jgi:hypothetical protein
VSEAGAAAAFRPQACAGLPQAELDGDLAVYDLHAQELLVLNRSARAIWSCCDGTGTVPEIVADIVEVFGAEPETVRCQVTELVADWSRRGLLECPVPEAPAPERTPAADAG